MAEAEYRETLHGESMEESIYKVSRKIKKKELQSLFNSLRSIYQDSQFIAEIQALWPELPLIANLRCGLWYSPSFYSTCYFKSTDGHAGNWSFNPTRLNMHVALSAAQRGGCFIVDATRQGKRFPDSFSKTIPIWTCVLNQAVYQYRKTLEVTNPGQPALDSDPFSKSEIGSWDCSLHLPLWVSSNEREKIEEQIDKWVGLLWAANADLRSLSIVLKKPLQPLWISQNTLIWLNEVPDSASWPFTPVILISASQPLPRSYRMSEGGCGWNYFPGAGDDEESWARGLTPALFWKHALSLIDESPENCTRIVAEIVERDRLSRAYKGQVANQIKVNALKKKSNNHNEAYEVREDHMQPERHMNIDTCQSQGGRLSNIHWIGETKLAVGSASCDHSAESLESIDCIIECGTDTQLNFGKVHKCLPILDSKHDRFSLQKSLFQAIVFAKESILKKRSLLILCANGEDLSVCVCLAILLALFNAEGAFDAGVHFEKTAITKWNVRQRLVYVCNYAQNARPSRGNLKQVFQFLLGLKNPSANSSCIFPSLLGKDCKP